MPIGTKDLGPICYIYTTQKINIMFGIFTRKSKQPEVIVAEPIKPAPMPNLATMLILAMTSYIEQNEKVSGQLVPVIPEVRKAYDRLLKLGMGQTQNARALQVQVEANNKATADQLKAKALIHFVKKAQEHFGPRTVLVSYSAFDDLCERYGLVRGALSDYCGVIPERNVQDIENVLAKIPTFSLINNLNHNSDMWHSDHYIYVTKAEVHHSQEDLVDFIEEHHNILRLRKEPSKYATYWFPADVYGYNYGEYGHLSSIYGTVIKPDTLFIACPPEYLRNPEIKVQPKPVDPAIYQFTPFGILVHTIWGEEAEDAAFKEFMELNLRIARS